MHVGGMQTLHAEHAAEQPRRNNRVTSTRLRRGEAADGDESSTSIADQAHTGACTPLGLRFGLVLDFPNAESKTAGAFGPGRGVSGRGPAHEE